MSKEKKTETKSEEEKKTVTTEIKQYETGIFATEHVMANMKMERFVVSNYAIVNILKNAKLSKKEQEEAVDLLVDRTPGWESLEKEDQINRIKTVLTTETVLAYLQYKNLIRPNVDVVEVGVDIEGSVVIYAFYTGTNRKKRREMMKKFSPEYIQEMIDAHNFLGGDNIIDLAQKKLERMQKAKEKKRR